MAANPVLPNIGLVLPVPGQTLPFGVAPPGQSWMELENTNASAIDQHDHTSGKGLRITPPALNINADVQFNTNNAIGLRSSRYNPIALGSLGVSDIGCTIVSGADLYYVDTAGNQVRITSGGALAGTPGSISGLASPASASYASGPKLFSFDSGVNITGGVACGPLVLTDSSTTSGNAATISVPTGLSASYALTLPAALPGSTKILTVSSAGAIGDVYDVDGTTLTVVSNLIGVPTGGIGTTQLAANAVTRAKLAAVGQQISSSGTLSTASTSPVNVTNCTVTLTTTGRPVMVFLAGLGGADAWLQASGGFNAVFDVIRDASKIYSVELSSGTTVPPGCFLVLDTPTAASHTYQVRAYTSNSGGTAVVNACTLVAYEL